MRLGIKIMIIINHKQSGLRIVGPGAVGKLEAPLPPSIVSRAPSTVRASAPAVAHVPTPIGIPPIIAIGKAGTAPGTGIAGTPVAEMPIGGGVCVA